MDFEMERQSVVSHSSSTQQSLRHRNGHDPSSHFPSFQRLSIEEASATPLPPSSPIVNSPTIIRGVHHHAARSPNPLRRSSSSMSIDRRSSSPALQRRTSSTSLRNGDAPPTPPKLSRRASSHQYLPSPLAPALEETQSVTAESVAVEYFQQELKQHNQPTLTTNTVVILHDSCYDHRYSRPGSLKAVQNTLSVIVERPERVQAGVMGISAAYVRLGERHAGGRNAPTTKETPEADIPFTIRKTSRLVPIDSPFVIAVHGTAWMKELKEMCGRVEQKLPSGKELERVPATRHEPAKEKLHEGDLYLSTESLQAFEGALGGVFDGVDAVFQANQNLDGPRQSFVCIRPPGHHCSASHPSGFCWINNVHVGINYAAQTYGLTHAAIIDFDLHHGDGSQSITWAHNENMAQPTKSKKTSPPQKYSIGYFSLHDINSYPCEYADREKVQNASLCIENAHGQSIWNVHLQKWTTETEFWQLYETKYITLLEKARSFLRSHTRRLRQDPNQPGPKAAIFLSAGFDASEHEHKMMQRHDVCVPTEFYARFTRDVIALAQEEATGVEGRIISVLEGGYSDKALMSGVLSHISGLCDGDLTKIKQESENGSRLGMEMTKGMMGLTISGEYSDKVDVRHVTYDPEWWHPDHLTILEQLLNPTPTAGPKPLGRKTRTGAYSSPTASSAAKIVEPSKVHRSVSGSLRFASASPSRASSPPPPDVDWIIATHELCKLLIPKDRVIRSFTSVELSESVAKKERRTTLEASSNATSSERQLRDRGKSRVLNQVNSSTTNNKTPVLRTVSETDRRKTIADLPVMASNGNRDEIPRPTQPRRRSSTASTISTVSAAPSVGATARANGPAVKLSSNGVQVKKTRNTSSVTAGQTTAKPPVPRIPSTHSTQSKQPVQGGSGPKGTPETREGSAEASNFDQLTSGFQKLKINVPSNEEYAARQQKKLADEGAKRAVPSKPAAKGTTGRTAKTTAAAKKAPTKDLKVKAAATKTPTIPSTGVQGSPSPTSHGPEVGELESVAAGIKQPLPSPPGAPFIQFQNSIPAVTGPSSPTQDFGNTQIPPGPVDVPKVGQQLHSQQNQPILLPYQPSLLAAAGVMGDGGQPFRQPQVLAFHHEYPMNAHVTANGHQQQDRQLQWQTPNKDLVSPTSGSRKTRSPPPKFSATGHIPFASAPTRT